MYSKTYGIRAVLCWTGIWPISTACLTPVGCHHTHNGVGGDSMQWTMGKEVESSSRNYEVTKWPFQILWFSN